MLLLETPSPEVLDELAARGIAFRVGALSHFVFAYVTRAQLSSLSHSPGVSRIVAAEEGDGDRREFSPPDTPGNSLTSAEIVTTYNMVGLNGGPPLGGVPGGAQRIGIVENAGCRLFSEHEAFTGISITEESTTGLEDCQTDLGCRDQCSGPGNPNASCIQGFCVDSHASYLLSAMAHVLENGAGDPQGYGAHEAQFFHPTIGAPDSFGVPRIICNDQGWLAAYEYLADSGVTTVAESVACNNLSRPDGVTQDFFARWADMAIFRAAGNDAEASTAIPCRPVNATCVGGFVDGNTIDPNSSHMNPGTPQNDREEPDIVALSREVDVISTQQPARGLNGYQPALDPPPNTSDWQQRNGTSYAAPAMAALGALTKQDCGGALNHNALRALMMTTAWAYNPDGAPYSTPGEGDGKDGAGGPTAETTRLLCGEANPADGTFAFGGMFGINVTGDGEETVPSWVTGTIEEVIGSPTPRAQGLHPGG
ncbi:MAG: S8 family serine peptidase, partial [Myxococcota bacterium]